MTNDGAVSPEFCVILMVAITVILAAVIAAFVFSMAGNVQKTQNCCNGCEQIKTSVITKHVNGGGIVFIRDSDGCEYSFRGWAWDYNEYDGHNVTFSYNPYNKPHGYTEITGIVYDYGPACCNANCGCQCGCGCSQPCVTPTPTPACNCGCRS